MSGSLGNWPISPAAKPANPAPSLKIPSRSSRERTGTSFALGRAYMSTNCAKTNSTPRSCICFQTASAVGAAVSVVLSATAMPLPPCSWGAIAVPPAPVAGEGAVSPHSGRLCVGFCASQHPLQLHHLHGDLDHEPVVTAQIESRELGDPA